MLVNLEELSKKFRYCILCSGELKKAGNNILLCTKCDHEHFINPAPTNAAILVNNKNELLLVKRKYDPQKGYWDLPGGFIDVNETAEESMTRELKEEIQANIDDFTYIGSFYDQYIYQGIEIPTISFVFKGTIHTENIEPMDDVEEITFFPFSEIPYPRLAFDSISSALDVYLRKK